MLTLVTLGFAAAPVSAQNTLTVANGTETNSYVPFYGYYMDEVEHTQLIYPASMLSDMQGYSITQMEFYLSGNPSFTSSITISLGISTDATFSGTSFDNTTSLTPVYTGAIVIANNVMTVEFDSPFSYTGGNLLFDLTNTSGNYTSATFYGITASGASLNEYNSWSGISQENFIPKTTFSYGTPSLCSKPTNVTATNITTSSATITWNGDANASSYNIEYMLSSETDWTNALTATVVGDTATTLTGLQPSSTYKVRVQVECSDNTQTVWSSVATFQTNCDAITITDSWIEDFEGYVGNNEQPFQCWATPVTFPGGGPFVYCGYAQSCHSGANSVEMKGYNNAVNMIAMPEFTNPLNTLRLTFWATSTNVSQGILEVGVMTDASDTSTFELVGVCGTPGARGGADGVAGNGNLMGPFDFNNVSATSGRIALRFTANGGSSYSQLSWNLDDFTVSFIPACAEPTGLANVNVVATSADITWNEVSGSSYELVYWENGGSDTTVVSNASLTDGVYTLDNLNPSSSYTWYVRTDCGDGTYAVSFAQVSFSTPGLPVTLPYERTFEEDADEYPVTEFTFQGTGDNQWVIGTATYMPDPNDATATGHSLYISNDNGVTNNYNTTSTSYAYAILNASFNDPMEYHLTFDYKTMGEGSSYTVYDYLSVYLVDADVAVPTEANPSGTALLSQQYNASEWTHADYILENVAGTSKQIVFFWKNDYSSGTTPPAAIDNISIEGFACASPSNPTANEITSSSAMLHWQENGTATAWTVYYRPVGSDTWLEETATEDSLELTNLGGNTKYEFYVAADCSGETSGGSSIASFRTECGNDGISVLPFSEDFQGEPVNGYVVCWTRSSSDSTGQHIVYQNVNEDWAWGSHALDFGYTPNCYTQAVLPMFDSSIPLNTLQVEFDARKTGASGAFLIGVMTDPEDDDTFEAIDTILPSCLGSYYSCGWEHFTVYLSNYLGNGQYIAFRADNCGNSGCLIDNLVVDQIPSCVPVSNVTVSAVTDQSASVSFTSNDAAQTAWTIYYRPVGSTDDYATENATDATGTTISGITPNTAYTVYVTADCSGEESAQSDAVTFTTTTVPAQLPYTEDFEDENDMMWVFVNGSQVNKWYVGTPSDSASDVNTTVDGTRGLYISNDDGASNAYTSISSCVYAYRDVFVPAGTTELNLSFDWKANGPAHATNFLRVYWIDPEIVTLTAGNNPPTVNGVNYDAVAQPGNYGPGGTEHWLAEASTWQHAEMNINSAQFQGMGATDKIYRLVFHWRNVYSGPANPPAAVDNVVLETVQCNAPSSIAVTNVTENSATVSWNGDASAYLVRVIQGSDTITETVTATTLDLTSLQSSTATAVLLQSICGSDSSVVVSANFTTSCGAITVTETSPWFENFEGYSGGGERPFVCWETPVTDDTYHGPFVYVGHAQSCHSGSNSAEMKGANNMLVLPAFTNDVQDLRLSFWATATSVYSGTLEVGVMTDPTNPNTFELVGTCGEPGPRGNQAGVAGNGNYMGPFDFTGITATGDSLRIALRYSNTSASASWNLDDFTVQLIPNCPSPVKTSVQASNIDAHSATITFTDNDTDHNSWTVFYREHNADPSDPWMDVTISTTSTDLTNLDPETEYDVYVVTNCTTTDLVPDATNTIQFTTTVACPAPTNVTITNIDLTSATVSWDGNADSYTVTCGDFTTTVTGNTTNITGLTSATNYTVSVVADCGADGSSSATTATFATTICALADQCAYTFNLTDSWGDGWNGASITVQQNGVAVATVAMTSGGTATEVVNLCDNMPTTLVWNSGYYDDEASFTVNGPDGTEIYATSGTPSGTLTTFTTSCNGSGPVVTDPTVATQSASNVGQTTATLNASFTNPDNVTITAMGFEWMPLMGENYVQVTTTPTGNGFSYDLSNLTPDVEYIFKAFITYNGTTVYGNELIFTTLAQGQATEPSATTLPASEIAQTTATLNGTIANPDNVTITAQGFEWKQASATSYTTVNATGTTMASPLTGLTANTDYTYRAFVTTANGTHYGTDVTFTTLEEQVEPCETPTNLHASDVDAHSITIGWNTNGNATSWNIHYRVENGTWNNATSNTNTYVINGLTAETVYEIEVQADCGNGNLSDWSAPIHISTTIEVGINSWLENSVSLYPNPAKEIVNVQCTMNNVQTAGELHLFDVYGKLLQIVPITSEITPVNVSNLANGMYFVRVVTEEGMVTKTFVKK